MNPDACGQRVESKWGVGNGMNKQDRQRKGGRRGVIL